MNYDHKTIEQKWQQRWKENNSFHIDNAVKRDKKKYVLDMFPYPSGAGLHVGHPEGYTATDIYCRYLRANGYDVLHPMGWDAFGLPAENYAIKTGVHPEESITKNIEIFTKQIQSLGFSYDWSREVNTASPEYYKWTQWIFLQLYKAGLAYKKNAPVNWCPSCQTVLANEQVIDGTCDRCKSEVAQKDLEQWFFKITGEVEAQKVKGKSQKYPDRLLNNLETLDWPSPIKTMQKNWIGKSEGINITYQIDGTARTITCFTTRPDTNFGATFITVAPESAFVKEYLADFPENEKVAQYVAEASKKSDLERMSEKRVKTGVATGWFAINQLNGKKMPVYVGDFVLARVGTGAVVGVPGHDVRDFEFAQAMNLDVVRVVVGTDKDESNITSVAQVQESAGTMINSDFLNGMDIHEATARIMDFLEEKGWGRRVINYKLRDWLISRQRYWGAPIPIIYCDTCGEQAVPEADLPVVLPTDVDFRPHGESPLARSASFHQVTCPVCGKAARRESDTMDTFVDSSWYFLRYTDSKNEMEFASKEALAAWLPVDVYVGGAEHAVLHLLYARFITMALYDLGYLEFEEPFLKLRNQGLIMGEDGQKMSKSRGNVINPDDMIEQFGADTLRMYEMFMGPLEDAKPWDTNGMIGVRRFLERVWSAASFIGEHATPEHGKEIDRELHTLIKKVTADIELYSFNTAIAQLMIFINAVYKIKTITAEQWEQFLTLLQPFAPHISCELWEQSGHATPLEARAWPEVDESLIAQAEVPYVVQVNGKVRATIVCAVDAGEEVVVAAAKENERIVAYLAGKEVVKQIFVPKRLVNFVVT